MNETSASFVSDKELAEKLRHFVVKLNLRGYTVEFNGAEVEVFRMKKESI